MKANKKALALVLCALMLVAASVFGTLAYLTDTDAVTNTFTVGHVDILLDEADVDENGVVETDDKGEELPRVTGNDYHLVPGHSYVKDPTVTVIDGSEESFIRMIVTVKNIDGLKAAIPLKDEEEQEINPEYYGEDGVFLIQKLCLEWDKNIWLFDNYKQETRDADTDKEDVYGIYEFRYYKTVDTYSDATEENVELEPLFKSIKLPGALINNAEMDLIDGVKVEVVAHAIQADGFVEEGDDYAASAAKAWAAFDTQGTSGIGNDKYGETAETTAANP